MKLPIRQQHLAHLGGRVAGERVGQVPWYGGCWAETLARYHWATIRNGCRVGKIYNCWGLVVARARSGAKPKIDIKTAIILPSQTMWAMHAGGSRKFAQAFQEESVIFLDLPGIDLNEGVLSNPVTLRRHVRMAEAIANYHRARARGKEATLNRNAQSYRSEARGETKSGLSARAGNVQALFQELKKGDIVFVPVFDGGVSRVAAGEVTHDYSPHFTIRHFLYPGEKIPARRVKWIGEPAFRKDFGEELSLRFSNRHAIIRLQKNLRRRAMEPIYRNVAVDDSSFSDIQGRGYTGKNVLALVEAINLLNEAITIAGRDVVSSRRRPAGTSAALEDFGLNFNSPGSFRTALFGAATASVLVGFLLALSCDVSQDVLATQLTVTNSASPLDRTLVPQAQEMIRSVVGDLDPGQFDALRQRAKRSVEEIGLNVDGQLTK